MRNARRMACGKTATNHRVDDAVIHYHPSAQARGQHALAAAGAAARGARRPPLACRGARRAAPHQAPPHAGPPPLPKSARVLKERTRHHDAEPTLGTSRARFFFCLFFCLAALRAVLGARPSHLVPTYKDTRHTNTTHVARQKKQTNAARAELSLARLSNAALRPACVARRLQCFKAWRHEAVELPQRARLVEQADMQAAHTVEQAEQLRLLDVGELGSAKRETQKSIFSVSSKKHNRRLRCFFDETAEMHLCVSKEG